MPLIAPHLTNYRLRRAEKLAGKGDRGRAIEYLLTRNEGRNRAALERALVDLLLEGETETQSRDLARTKPGDVLTVQPGEVPEIPAAELSAAVLHEAIGKAGHLIVRGLFAEADVTRLRDCIDHALDSRYAVSSQARPPADDDPWYYPSPKFPGMHEGFSQLAHQKQYGRTGSMMVIDSPRGTSATLEFFRKYGMKALLEDYFGEPSVIATRKWTFRLVEPKEIKRNWIGGGWHQDGQFMGEGVNALNLWAPLSDCGDDTDAPGIALLPRRLNRVLEYGTHEAKIEWMVGPELVRELAAETPVVTPHFNAGDALFFDQFSLHRSGHVPGKRRQRYALESWFYGRSGTGGNAVLPLV
ncbi:MAG: hypothetical protein HKN19_18705 [Halioglobus sp.]|nr:hypothetical protein [Halioglobus sp.]